MKLTLRSGIENEPAPVNKARPEGSVLSEGDFRQWADSNPPCGPLWSCMSAVLFGASSVDWHQPYLCVLATSQRLVANEPFALPLITRTMCPRYQPFKLRP